MKKIYKAIIANQTHQSLSICLAVLFCLILPLLLTGKMKESSGFKTAFIPEHALEKEFNKNLENRNIGLPPGDFNASITASSASVNAGTGVTYTINYSTGATAANIDGARIRVFLPVPALNGGLVTFNGTTDVVSSNLSPTVGGFNYDIYFVSPINAGKQGMMELTVIYPEGTICNGTPITATATATTNSGASDGNLSDNSAAVTVNDTSNPWSIDVVQDNLRTLGAQSNYRVRLVRNNGTVYDLTSPSIQLTIPTNAVVNSCGGCVNVNANPLTWTPGTLTANTEYSVSLTYNAPNFAVADKVALSGSFSGTNATCAVPVTGTDMVMGNIPPPPPSDPQVDCDQPTLSTTTIGRNGTTAINFSNSGNTQLGSFTVTVDFPDEVQITAIPDATYSNGGLNVNVNYVMDNGSNAMYNFVTNTSVANGGATLAPNRYLTRIVYTFVDSIPAGFMPSSPLVFNYTVVNATVNNATANNGANPRITDGTCTACTDDDPNTSGFGCLEARVQVSGRFTTNTPSSSCSNSAVARDEAVGPQNIVKSVSPGSVYPRDIVTFTLKFDQCGLKDLVGASIIDELPAQFTYVTGSSAFQGGAIGNPTNAANILTWTLASPLPGDQVANADTLQCTTYTLTFQATVNDMTAPSTLTNCFSLAGTMPGNPDAIEVCDAAELEDCADVQILPVGPNNPNKMVCQDLTLPFNTIFPEDNILYKLQWAHLGNFDIKELMLSDTLPLQFTYTVGSVVYSSNIQTLINNYKIGNPSFEPFSTVLTMDGRTILKWNFTGLIFPGAGASFEIKYNVIVKAGTPPGNITNCFNVEGVSGDGQGNNVRMDAVRDCDQINVKPVGPINTDKTISVTDGTVQPTEELYYTLKFQNSGPFDVGALQISDILPSYLEFVQSEAIQYTNIPQPTSFSYNPATRELRWQWTSVTGANSGSEFTDLKEIKYKVRVKNGVLAGTNFNNCFRIDGRGTNIDPRRITTGSGGAESETLSPYLEQGCSDDLTVLTLATVASRKGIKGECDPDFVYFDSEGATPPDLTNLNGIGRTIPGGEATYRLEIINPGNIVIENITLIDILPFIGDKGVLRVDENRSTQWRPTLAEPIVAPTGVTVYYSLEQNPCRTEFDPDINPAGCTGPSWSTTPPSDISLVQSIKLDFSDLDLNPADTFAIEWKMYAPFNAPEELIAWNSYAFQGTRKDNNNKFLTAEPNKVGLAIKRDSKSQLGNYVWLDEDENGLQNEGPSSGVNGIKVYLFSSTDNIKGNGNDQQIDSTFTVNDYNGNPGYYLFPNLDAGYYYVIFDPETIPATSSITTQNANSNGSDDTDSDADPVMGMTSIVNLGLPDQNLSLDMGLVPADCFLSGTRIIPACSDNGTPNNLNDDKITLQELTAFKTGTAGGSLYSLIIERCTLNMPTVQLVVVTDLEYGQTYGPYGPYDLASDQMIKVTVIDQTNPLCRIVDRVLGCTDYGDLPDSYVTTGENAPRHLVQMDKLLGTCVDTEFDGTPNSTAQGDNQAEGSREEGNCGPNGDEDGIEFLTPLVPGDTACIRVTYISPTTGDPLKLNAFIDFNGDGNFDIDAGNTATDDQLDFLVGNSATINAQLDLGGLDTILCFIVPSNATFVNGDIYARFRLSCDGDLGPAGVNPDGSVPPGEIEDYYRPTAKIGNLVWFDVDIDGTQDSNEPGLEGIEVALIQAGEDKTFGTIDDFVSLDTTDANGVYAFCGVIENDSSMYKILIQTPENLLPGFANADGVSDVLDNDGEMLMPDVTDVVQTMFLLTDVQELPVNENGTADSGSAGVNGYPDGQVDETFDFGFIAIDLGDLPEMAQGEMFPTSLINDGASHTVPDPILTPEIPYLYLGSTVDVELDGQPTALTNGDDNAGTPDDEDGITVLTPMVPGYEACVEVRSTIPSGILGYLQGWIDFNGNGKFDGAEQVATNYTLVSGTDVLTTVCFEVPQNAVFNDGMAFMRWRLSTQQNLAFTGHALDGEVEDYKENLGKLGNLVWYDKNFNGQQDEGEAGIADVPVTLVWGGDDDDVATPNDNRSYETLTDENGLYYICGIIPGDYKIIVNTPDGLTPTRSNATGVTDSLDSDGILTGMDLSMSMESFTVASVTALPTEENGLGDTPNVVNNFADNQFDQTHDFGYAGLDYGDLPQEPQGEKFNTTMAEGGPIHVIIDSLRLGYCVDAERDGSPDADAGAFDGKDGDQGNGDDGNPGGGTSGDEDCTDDEDGIRFITPLIPGFDACVEVTYSTPAAGGVLQAWIDFNGNGTLDSGEELAFNGGGALSPGTTVTDTLCFEVPKDAVFNDGMAFVRFRLSPTGGLAPDGPSKFDEAAVVPAGEVEDYMLKLAKVGNLVWEDRNWNGQQDDLEEDYGINGTVVALIYAGANGTIETSLASASFPLTALGDDRIYYDTTTTYTYKSGDTLNGFYYFCGLIEGTYDVVVLGPKDLTPTRPNLITTSQDEDKDSDGLETARDLLTQHSLAHSGAFTIADQAAICTRVEGEEGIGDQDLSNLLDVNNVGTFPDKQVDQRFDFGFIALDFGDLPQEGELTGIPGKDYNTTLAQNGPRHIVKPNFFLGKTVDADLDGAPDDQAGSKAYGPAEGDDQLDTAPDSWAQGDTTIADDEDGIQFLTPLVPGYEACIAIRYALPDNFNGPDGYLNAWIDWNGNDSLEAGEKLQWVKQDGNPAKVEPNTGALELERLDVTTIPGKDSIIVCFKVPQNAAYYQGNILSRFRLSESPRLNPEGILPAEAGYTNGKIPCGEVEDYFMKLSKVGNLVWEDRNYNGLQDVGEPPIKNVIITLEFAGIDTIFGNGALEYTYRDTTDADGRYSFCGLIGSLDPSGIVKPTYRLTAYDPASMTATFNKPDPSDDNGIVNNSNGDDLLIDNRLTRDTFSIINPMNLPVGELDPNGLKDQGTITTGPLVTNVFPDMQIDETRDFGYVGLDYGDLPVANTSYLTLRDSVSALFNNKFGPRHAIQPKLYLGEGVDGELNGQPDADAGSKNGGDDDGQSKFGKGSIVDDETGVRLLSPMIPGELAYLKVTYTSQDTVLAGGYANKDAYLRSFIDFNGDGDLNDATDVLTFTAAGSSMATLADITDTDNPILAGGVNQMQVLAFRVPLGATYRDGTAFIRHRLSWEVNVGPDNNAYHTATSPYVNTGLAYPRGEVEDYAVPIAKVGNLAWFDHDVKGDQNENDFVDTLQLVLVWGGLEETTGKFDTVGYQSTMGSAGSVTDVLYNLSIVPNGAATMPPASNDTPGQIVKTNADGLYSFQGLIPGNYYLIPLKYLQPDSASFVNAYPKHRVLTLKDNPGVDDQNDSDGMPGALIRINDGNGREPEVCVSPQPKGERGKLDSLDAENMKLMSGRPFPDSLYNQTIDFGWVDEPNIEANLDIVGVYFPTSQICGNFNVIMHLCVKNPQEVPLDSLQAFLDLKAAYGNALYTASKPVVSIADSAYVKGPAYGKYKKSQLGAKAQLVPNPNYDGVSDLRLLIPTSENTNFILKGDSVVCIRVEFEIDPTKVEKYPWKSQGSVTARAVGFNKQTGAKRPLTDYFVKSPRFGKTIVVSDLTDEINDPMPMAGLSYPDGGDGIAFEGSVADRDYISRDKYKDENDKTIQNDECWRKTKWNSGVQDVRVALNSKCESIINADIFVPNFDPACGFDKYTEGSYYAVIIQDKWTNETVWTSDDPRPFDAKQFLGRDLIYKVKSVSNFCNPIWGNFILEDKIAPVVTCAVDTDRKVVGNTPSGSYTFVCTDIDSVLNVKKSWTNTNYPYYTGVAVAKDSCGSSWLDNVTDKLEVLTDCDKSANAGYAYARITRTFTFTDDRGNKTTCNQIITFRRPKIVLPECKVEVPNNLASASADLLPADLIKSPFNLRESVPYYLNGAGKRIYLTGRDYCGFGVNFTDETVFKVGECGRKVIRRWTILDWCYGSTGSNTGAYPVNHIIPDADAACYAGLAWDAGLNMLTWEQHLIVGDNGKPIVSVPDFDNDGKKGSGYRGGPEANPDTETGTYDPGDILTISTSPMDCKGATTFGRKDLEVIEQSKWCFDLQVVQRVAILDLFERPTGRFEWKTDGNIQVKGDCDKGYTITGIPMAGRWFFKLRVFDVCYGDTTIYYPVRAVDKIAPVMKCDDKLVLSLNNGAFGQVSAAQVDEGSWDNCGKVEWLKVRRPISDECNPNFIKVKGVVDANNNGKIDAYNASSTQPQDYVDVNNNRQADPEEYFKIDANSKLLMTPLMDSIPFFCCDRGSVMVELWGGDKAGNRNYCWNNIVIEDKTPPICVAPWAITVHCDDKNLAFIDSKVASAKVFGDVTITSGSLCGSIDTVYSVVKKLKCGAGTIERIWTLTKQTGKGPVSVTCKQIITVLPLREYNICFPKDANFDCKTPIVDTLIKDELGCDLLAVNVSDKRYDASDDECYKIFRTYTVIDWCAYNDVCGAVEDHLYVIDRGTFENFGKAAIYLLVRDEDRDQDEEFYLSENLSINESKDFHLLGDVAPKNAYKSSLKATLQKCSNEYYHAFQYTQIIKVYDSERPVVTGIRDTFCTSPTACTANITKVVTIADKCTDQVELEQRQLMIAPFQTLDAGAMIVYSTPRWSTKALGNGKFEITVTGLPEGTHDLIVVGRDECGNLSVPTRIPFVVKDCKAPAPICVNGLSVNLMPDGNGGGMMTVWATDFVASKIYDCNGQGPETKDGLKLITKYSINRVKEAVNPNQTSISVNCKDLELGFILVELHAWDEKGNHDFCVSYLEVQDNNNICKTASVDAGQISGLITTDELEPVLGVNLDLSGGAQLTQNTGSNGAYLFNNLVKDKDYTVAAQLDKDHLNGVSTFDLVLIQKHILGTKSLDNPYRMIAADVNNSKSISTLDMIQIRKLILNIDTKFTNVPSWKFVDATYKFTESSNPWSSTFPEVVNVNDLVGKVKADFIGIKMGDVNGNASASGAVATEIRGAKQMILNTEEQQLKVGQSYTVVFKAKDLAQIQGYQFTLNVDPSLAQIENLDYSGIMKAENFGFFPENGMITTSYVRAPLAGAPVGGEAILFTLKLRANSNTALSSVLDLNSRLTHLEAYNQNDEVMGVKLNFGSSSVSDQAVLRQNTPNPFADETAIGFYLPKATKGVLTIRDVKGALIYRVEGNYAKGNNQLILKQDQLRASGVFYYTLQTNDFTDTKKMVLLNK
jgi:uncharacterized repeat protein (TIGR01451 family)